MTEENHSRWQVDADKITEERYKMYVKTLKKSKSSRSSGLSSSSSCSLSSVDSVVTANEDNSIDKKFIGDKGDCMTESIVRDMRQSRGISQDCLPAFALDCLSNRLCGNAATATAATSASSTYASDSSMTLVQHNGRSTVPKGLSDFSSARLLARTNRLVREKDDELRQAQLMHQSLMSTNDSTIRELTQQCQKLQAHNRQLQEELEQTRSQVKLVQSQLEETVLQLRQNLQVRQHQQSDPIRMDDDTVATAPRRNTSTSPARITHFPVEVLLKQLMIEKLNSKSQSPLVEEWIERQE